MMFMAVTLYTLLDGVTHSGSFEQLWPRLALGGGVAIPILAMLLASLLRENAFKVGPRPSRPRRGVRVTCDAWWLRFARWPIRGFRWSIDGSINTVSATFLVLVASR